MNTWRIFDTPTDPNMQGYCTFGICHAWDTSNKRLSDQNGADRTFLKAATDPNVIGTKVAAADELKVARKYNWIHGALEAFHQFMGGLANMTVEEMLIKEDEGSDRTGEDVGESYSHFTFESVATSPGAEISTSSHLEALHRHPFGMCWLFYFTAVSRVSSN